MTNMTESRRLAGIPYDAWYAAALSNEVGLAPLARRVLGQPVVLYRSSKGDAVALADRCVHAPVALSDGRVEDDDIIAPYSGFRYGPTGVCISVPTQAHVPYGATVHAYPVIDDGTFVWIWPGRANLAPLRPAPSTPWLREGVWRSFGDSWETAASLRLMQDNFADITHVAQVDPVTAPPVLSSGNTPPLTVSVTETSVSFSRNFPPSQLSTWQSTILGTPAEAKYAQREEGEFVSPGLWVDRWSIKLDDQDSAQFIFTHALTPVSAGVTRHVWRVSRNFVTSPAADGTLIPIFENYYRRVRGLLEAMQQIVDVDGPAHEVRVAADAAGSQVRRIMERLAEDEIQ